MLKILARLWLIGLMAILALALGTGPAAAWEPTKTIEFVIQTSPGGGSDKYARFWIGIIEKYKLSPVPIVPVNRPGGAGAVALTELYNKRGDPHYITPTLNSVITTPLVQKIPVMYPSKDLTPIVNMAIDPFFLVVHPDNFKTFEEFVKACRERRLTAAGTGAKQEDEIQINMLQHALKCQPIRYVPEKGGGDVAKSVAGKHADFNVNQPAEFVPHMPQRLIPILAFQKERAKAFPEAPTHWEKNVSGEWAELLDLKTGLHQHRGIIGPPGIPKEAIAWYEKLFRKIFETKEWQEFMAKRAMDPQFMNSEQYTKFLFMYEKNHVRVLRGVIGWKLRDDLNLEYFQPVKGPQEKD